MKTHQFSTNHEKGWAIPAAAREFDAAETVVMCFFAAEVVASAAAFANLRSAFSKSTIVGCSTSGEIFGAHVHDASMSVLVMRFEQARFRTVSAEIGPTDGSFAAGKELGKTLKEGDLRGVVVFSDGLNCNGSALARGLNEGCGDPAITVFGGLAGDGNRFQKTWTLVDGKLSSNTVVAVGFFGRIRLAAASRGGWDNFGPERRITRSQGNIVYEIDGRAALDLYKEYLGPRAAELPGSGLLFPMEIRASRHDDKHLVRTILGIDEVNKSLVFAGDVPQGWLARLMRANFDRLIDSAGDAGTYVAGSSSAEQSVVLAVSCVGRRGVLGIRTEDELEALCTAVGHERVVGFYSYGELAPALAGSACDLHNQTMTTLSIDEA